MSPSNRLVRWAAILFAGFSSVYLFAWGDRIPTAAGAAAPAADGYAAFFAAYENGDVAAALAALPPAVRDASLYDAEALKQPPFDRDSPIYFKLVEKLESGVPVAKEEIAESTVHYALGVFAYRAEDWEAARRRFLLAALKNPASRMTHIYLARVYRHMEDAALKGAKEGEDAGSILIAKVGAGSSDQHIDMAQEILDRDGRDDIPSLIVAFKYDKGAVKDYKAEWTTASGNARLQRQAVPDEPGSCRVELCGSGRVVLDEKLFRPTQTIFWDGLDEQKKPIGGKDERTTFEVSLELLSLTPSDQVIVFDAKGRKIFAAPVPAAAPAAGN
jgi:tetratricopeptide (TPR) repeat protein